LITVLSILIETPHKTDETMTSHPNKLSGFQIKRKRETPTVFRLHSIGSS